MPDSIQEKALAASAIGPTPGEFIASVAPAAQRCQLRWGVPASVTIAQAILETGWGDSLLAREGNNFFGMKCTDAAQAFCLFSTTEFLTDAEFDQLRRAKPWVVLAHKDSLLVNGKYAMVIRDRFRKFDSAAECFDEHGEMLATEQRYKPAMEVSGDSIKFARQLQSCGYSTNPGYASLLEELMTSKKRPLLLYDDLEMPGAAAANKEG